MGSFVVGAILAAIVVATIQPFVSAILAAGLKRVALGMWHTIPRDDLCRTPSNRAAADLYLRIHLAAPYTLDRVLGTLFQQIWTTAKARTYTVLKCISLLATLVAGSSLGLTLAFFGSSEYRTGLFNLALTLSVGWVAVALRDTFVNPWHCAAALAANGATAGAVGVWNLVSPGSDNEIAGLGLVVAGVGLVAFGIARGATWERAARLAAGAVAAGLVALSGADGIAGILYGGPSGVWLDLSAAICLALATAFLLLALGYKGRQEEAVAE